MRLQEIQHSFRGRIRNPAYWVVLLSLGLLSVPFFPWQEMRVLLRILPFTVLWFPIVFLCPAPWQWTGDDRPLAPWGRGILQAFAYALLAAALHGLLVWILRGKGNLAFVLGLVTGLAVMALVFLVPLGILIARGECLSREAREAKAMARQAQWMGHRGAFSPRLLFGNLDYLADLAPRNPQGTEQGLVELAALYRQWLVEAEKPLISLGAEMRMVEQYLALEQKRWRERLRVRTRVELEQEGQAVPPLILLSFLEQALTGAPLEGAVEVDIQASGRESWLEIRMEFRGPAPNPSPDSFSQARRRILAVLEREGAIALTPSETGWSLSLNLPKRVLEATPCS